MSSSFLCREMIIDDFWSFCMDEWTHLVSTNTPKHCLSHKCSFQEVILLSGAVLVSQFQTSWTKQALTEAQQAFGVFFKACWYESFSACYDSGSWSQYISHIQIKPARGWKVLRLFLKRDGVVIILCPWERHLK